MMTFRKLSASSNGRLISAYFTENTPDPVHDFRTMPGKVPDSGERLTSYYTGRDGRATWRPDMTQAVADVLGVDRRMPPKADDLARLFEAKRADNGDGWSANKRAISAYDLTLAPHKSVSLAAEFAQTPAETAMIWHAIDRANDATMRYVARELGWARKGDGGKDGADPGQVGWVSFRHHTARPTMEARDGATGATYLIDSPSGGDPHAHIHNALFNMVVTEDGRVGSLDTQRLHARVHEFGAYFQATLADELRRLGARVGYDKNEQAVTLDAIPTEAVDLFSKGRRQVLRSAKDYATEQGLDWETLSLERKQRILAVTGLASRLKKDESPDDRTHWRAQAEAIGWSHKTVLKETEHASLSATDRLESAYKFAARHIAKEFETAAVIDHDKLRLYAARGLIGTGIDGIKDIDRVVGMLEARGIQLRGEHVALVMGMSGETVRVTNTAQMRIEQALAQEATRASADRSGALSPDAIRTAIRASRLDLDGAHGKAQEAAIYALGQGSALSMLTGVAGAGKTTLLKPLVQAWEADTRHAAGGREVIGLSMAWRQADALADAGIDRRFAMSPFLHLIEKGEITATRNTVLVIDEVSQIAPRQMLQLLELQRTTGLTIKALGDREQAQAIEAGDAIEILRRTLPATEMPVLTSTVRQKGKTEEETQRLREIAGLFRGQEPDVRDLDRLHPRPGARIKRGAGADPANPDAESEFALRQEFHFAEVQQALAMKREDGTAMLVGGDHDEVLGRIADLYMERRDALRAAGAEKGITISALTNQDAADLSQAVRQRMRARGELGADEIVVKAIDQRGEQYDMAIASGDKVRLFRRTWGRLDGTGGYIGNNGDIVEVLAHTATGLKLRAADGRIADVENKALLDEKTGRVLLGFGHAMTIDAAQGMTSDEHINALPRGVATMTGFTGYVAESRARGKTWTMIADGATFEAVRNRRAIGDITPVTSEDLWDHVATAMANKPYKPLGMDLAAGHRRDWAKAAESLMRLGHLQESTEANGRNLGQETRMRLQAEAVRMHIPKQIAALDAAIVHSMQEGPRMSAAETHLRRTRLEAEEARRALASIHRSSSPSPGG